MLSYRHIVACCYYALYILYVSNIVSSDATYPVPGTNAEVDTSLISDCKCDFYSVNDAVSSYFAPILKKLTERTFFRYFRVDLDSSCPFWQEDGQCFLEGCSVCTCEDSEIPKGWIRSKDDTDTAENLYTTGSSSSGIDNGNINADDGDDDYGWISPYNDDNTYLSESYKVLQLNDHDNIGKYIEFLRETEDEDEDTNSWSSYNYNNGVYVNLLKNPESFTGYSGPSARKVWASIQQENCFGAIDDVCLEKRVFYRLMSGLQSSISTHIARSYHYPDGRSGHNIQLFNNAVGNHPDRLDNLYFSFLFLLRAVVKASQYLIQYPYYTGNSTDDMMVREIMSSLGDERNNRILQNTSVSRSSEGSKVCSISIDDTLTNIDECKNGFDESYLFQVSQIDYSSSSSSVYDQLEKQHEYTLKQEFQHRFRNITKIMDCITCEKCRVWGKLQTLGIGTAIKLLLSTDDDLNHDKIQLHRQEIIAIINTLHQFATSIDFVSYVRSLSTTITTAADTAAIRYTGGSSSSDGTDQMDAASDATKSSVLPLIISVAFILLLAVTALLLCACHRVIKRIKKKKAQ